MSVSEETRDKWKSKLTAIRDAVNYKNIELSEWEDGFINSIYEPVFIGKDISFKQSSCLSRIYQKIN